MLTGTLVKLIKREMHFRCTGVRKQILIASCVYLGQLMVGYTGGWTAPAILKLKDPSLSPLSKPITDIQLSFVGSIIYLGGLAGPYITGYLSNKIGRKPCMLVGTVILIIAYLILANAWSLTMLYIGRFLSGFGVGIIVVMALVYLGEVVSTNIRGVFLTGIGIFITCGSLIAFSIGPFVSYSISGYVGVCIACMYALAVLWIPETPTYYALKGKNGAARNVLKDLGRIDDLDKVLTSKIKEDSLRDWNELFVLKGNRRALIITIILNISQHGSGIIAVTAYATSIFELAGSTVEPAIATIILGCTQLFGGLITPLFIESSGRRKLLLVSTAVCCLSMLVLGVYFYLNYLDHWILQRLKWLPLVSLVAFYVGYDSGLGIIPNALAGEMFEPNVRSKGCAFAVTISWLCGFCVTTAFGSLITIVGAHVLFWFFSSVCALTFIYILFIPETKGKSLKEIREMLSK